MIRGDCFRDEPSWRNTLELSGVDKLLALSRELGLREAGEVARSRRASIDRSTTTSNTRIGRSTRDPGLEVSISAAASRLADEDAKRVERPPADIPISAGRSNEAAVALNDRRGRAIAAYQRNARFVSGENIRVRV